MSDSLALLRGVNVGGNALIKMADLRTALEADGFKDVRTYIASGNVIFRAGRPDAAARVARVIKDNFKLDVEVVVFTAKQWRAVVDNAPSWWGDDEKFRHYLLILLDRRESKKVIDAIGELKPDIELIETGPGVLYQSVEIASIGKATSGSKLASNAAYKRMTIRNYNTAVKLAKLLSS